MGIRETLQGAQDAATVRRVYGDPYEVDGTTIIPAAAIRGGGGGGGGGGQDREGNEGQGEGMGYGLSARPVGAYINKGGSWSWMPAFDLNKFLFLGHLVAVVYFVTHLLVERAKARAQVKIARSG